MKAIQEMVGGVRMLLTPWEWVSEGAGGLRLTVRVGRDKVCRATVAMVVAVGVYYEARADGDDVDGAVLALYDFLVEEGTDNAKRVLDTFWPSPLTAVYARLKRS